MTATTISQRELRNDSAKVIRRLQQGETFVLTNHGVPVAELRPLHGPQRIVSRDVLVAAAAHWGRIDAAEFMGDVDDGIDQTVTGPYTGKPL